MNLPPRVTLMTTVCWNIILRFFVSGSVGALEKWLSGEDKISSDELAKIIVNPELLKKSLIDYYR